MSETALQCRTWPFEEAKKVLKRIDGKAPKKGYVLFETGYGPSGLPHIGTFQEVLRTTMVMTAFRMLAPDIPVKLVCFSDDMDGLRKIPGNLTGEQQAALKPYVEDKDRGIDGSPLSEVPNPFGSNEQSYADHNNTCLRDFLDSFGFAYEFVSSTEHYKGGEFNDTLRLILKNHQAISDAVKTILGPERQETYSPLLPVYSLDNPEYGEPRNIVRCDSVIRDIDVENGTAEFEAVSGPFKGEKYTHSVLDGQCKAQWRVDWALRWYALDVDYEMGGEDLISSGEMAGKIVNILGGRMPEGFRYKLFLDEHGQKISKSKGNGLSMEEWLRYAPPESLAYYMYLRPTSGKKLYFDIIPKAVDEYLSHAEKLSQQEPEKILENPAWYIHAGKIEDAKTSPLSFALLLNLASAANAHDRNTMWGFIQRYAPEASPETEPFLDHLVTYAVRYYEDFVLPAKQYRLPDEREHRALSDLAKRLEALPAGSDIEALQTEVFSAGKENGYDKSELRNWFQAIYEILIGQSQGPRFGSFIALYGVDKTIVLIQDALDGVFVRAA